MLISFSKIWPALLAAITLRMLGWLLAGAVMLGVSLALAHYELAPQLQNLTWTAGRLCLGAFLGYWIDRASFRDRIDENSPWPQHHRRALIQSAAIIGIMLAV